MGFSEVTLVLYTMRLTVNFSNIDMGLPVFFLKLVRTCLLEADGVEQLFEMKYQKHDSF